MGYTGLEVRRELWVGDRVEGVILAFILMHSPWNPSGDSKVGRTWSLSSRSLHAGIENR